MLSSSWLATWVIYYVLQRKLRFLMVHVVLKMETFPYVILLLCLNNNFSHHSFISYEIYENYIKTVLIHF